MNNMKIVKKSETLAAVHTHTHTHTHYSLESIDLEIFLVLKYRKYKRQMGY